MLHASPFLSVLIKIKRPTSTLRYQCKIQYNHHQKCNFWDIWMVITWLPTHFQSVSLLARETLLLRSPQFVPGPGGPWSSCALAVTKSKHNNVLTAWLITVEVWRDRFHIPDFWWSSLVDNYFNLKIMFFMFYKPMSSMNQEPWMKMLSKDREPNNLVAKIQPFGNFFLRMNDSFLGGWYQYYENAC